MSTMPGPASRSAIGNTPRVYPPDLQPLLQSILAALADIDFVHASEVVLIRDSDADEWLKQSVIRRLDERHRERPEPIRSWRDAARALRVRLPAARSARAERLWCSTRPRARTGCRAAQRAHA